MFGMTKPVTPFHVTLDDVYTGIDTLAAIKPGVYVREDDPTLNGCVNVVDVNGVQKPSCIVGSYLAMRVGVENIPTSGDSTGTLDHLVAVGLITVTPEARYLLRMAQALQDTHKVPWAGISSAMYNIVAAGHALANDSK